MPTGYTAILEENPNLSFRDFALRCARAMGACIMQRDDSMNAPMVMEESPSDYHMQQYAEIEAKIAAFSNMTPEQISAEWKQECDETIALCIKEIERMQALRTVYESMLEKVRQWQAPQECFEFKQFMIEQLKSTIDYDCNDSYWRERMDECTLSEETPLQWRDQKIARWTNDLEYHQKKYTEEVERVKERNAWKRALVDSLPPA